MHTNMDDEDLDLNVDNTAGGPSQAVRKNINLKLRPGSKPRGRGRKPGKGSKKKPESPPPLDEEEENDNNMPLPGLGAHSIQDHEIQLSPVKDREPWSHSQKITWKNKVNLIGEKVVDPMIHSCDTCALPILIYGRMIPCKHVFCFNCAKKTEKNCPRCKDPVQRIEQSALGTVFICSFGGSKHTPQGCKRTYLSQRDLQAHIDHRHMKQEAKGKRSASSVAASQASLIASTGNPVKITIPDLLGQAKINIGSSPSGTAPTHTQPVKAPPPAPPAPGRQEPGHYRGQTQEVYIHHPPPPMAQPPPQPQMAQAPPPLPPPASLSQAPESYRGSSIPVMSSRTNLITVPIQGAEAEYKPPLGYPPVSFPQSRPPGPGPAPFPAHSHPPPLHQVPPPNFSHPPLSMAVTPNSYTTAPMSIPGPIPAPGQLPPRPIAVTHTHGAPGGPPIPVGLPARPPIGVPPPHVGGVQPPGPLSQGMPPPRYPSPHRQYEETPMSPSYNPPGGHSPRPPWPGTAPPRGPPGGPPPPRPQSSGAPAPRPPDTYQYFQRS